MLGKKATYVSRGSKNTFLSLSSRSTICFLSIFFFISSPNNKNVLTLITFRMVVISFEAILRFKMNVWKLNLLAGQVPGLKSQ